LTLRDIEERQMADDKTKVGGEDRARININEKYEIRDWSQSLGVDENTLIDAVKTVGDRVEDVRNHLHNKKGV